MNPTVQRLEDIKPVVRHMADDYENTSNEEVENLRDSLANILLNLEPEPTFVVLAEQVRNAVNKVDFLLQLIDARQEPIDPADDLLPVFFRQGLMDAHSDLTATSQRPTKASCVHAGVKLRKRLCGAVRSNVIAHER